MAWYFEQHDTIGLLTFDLPGEKINKLTTPVMHAFIAEIDRIAALPNIRVLVIRSGKADTFIAGADIQEIASISTPKEAREKATIGQSILNRLSKTKMLTIAAINGACLGGGLELALACDFRIVSDNPKTLLGLPEVGLGIIPGFGGTQRLPRLIGLSAALPLILSGKPVPAQKAEKLGLADRCVSTVFFDDTVLSFAKEVEKNAKKIRALRQKNHRASLFERSPFGIFIIGMLAKRQILQATQGHYPAPLQAIKAVQYGALFSLRLGLAYEAKRFSKLAATDISKNLISLFFIQEALKKDTQSETIQIRVPATGSAIGVLGAGLMGGGIAWLGSAQGFFVRMKDIQWPAIAKGYAAAQKIYAGLVKKKKIKPHEFSMGMNRISGTVDYSGFKRTDIVIEAIVEDITIKKNVFTDLESAVRPDTIIASNTSALSITEMAATLKHPERFIGMHFFSPVNRMPLVEIIPGENTSPDTIATMVAFSKSLKKTPIVVKNCPGFLVNRILIPYVNEALHLIEDGGEILEIDTIMTTFGMPLGPLALADEVGLDVGYKVAKHLEAAYPDRMKVASSFEPLYKNDFLGKKNGKGFYSHGKKKTVNTDSYKHISRRQKRMDAAEILDRLILMMVNEAARCYDEKIVASAAYLDMAMVLGTGFPPFRLGPLRYADTRGIAAIAARLQDLSETVGLRFSPAPILKEMADSGARFYPTFPYGVA